MTLLTTEEMLESSVSDKIKHSKTEMRYKKKSLWKPIAKNEIRIRTSGVRNHRILFFAALYSLLLLWAFIVAPLLE
ncbi:unnamed protein product, partial [marine sediment metagenome]